ncbi:MAG: hypothetical protein ACC655_10110, partial [Rhodothermia bacterium]
APGPPLRPERAWGWKPMRLYTPARWRWRRGGLQLEGRRFIQFQGHLQRIGFRQSGTPVWQFPAQTVYLIDFVGNEIRFNVDPKILTTFSPGDPETMRDDGSDQQATTDQDEIFYIHVRLPGRICDRTLLNSRTAVGR